MIDNGVDRTGKSDLQKEVEELRKRIEQYELGWPPGHFYSPIPSLSEIAVNASSKSAEGFRLPRCSISTIGFLAGASSSK